MKMLAKDSIVKTEIMKIKLKFGIMGRLFKSKQERELQRVNELRAKIFSTDTPMPEVDRATLEALEIMQKNNEDMSTKNISNDTDR